ncbi:Spc7 kinetochore protein [Seiridium cupressi]
MSSRTEAAAPPARRPRKSTGHSPVRKRMDKENITVDVASSLAGNAGRKKSRSKSMGPGGLDALKPGSGNRRVSLAAPARPPPRSILKPTIPILPEIPPHKPKSRYGSSVQSTETPHISLGNDDSSSSGTKIALRTEEEQQAAARKREEEERSAMEKEIKDRREARRKSLANRRVSFAAEATLHTFHEVEYMQDSTTSTDSTRRASSLAAQSPAPVPAPAPAPTPVSPEEAAGPPSTPPEQEDLVPDTPEDQRDLHQKTRRRSSGASTLNFHDQDDDTIASTVYSSDSEGPDGVIETHEEILSDSGSDSDNDGTTMDLDIDEITGTSIASGRSNWTDHSNNSDNDTLDDALRLAQRQAQTQSIDEEEEIIPSFGWAKKPAPVNRDQPKTSASQARAPSEEPQDDNGTEMEMDMDMDMDMEMTHAIGGIIKSNVPENECPDEEMSMDVTKVLGGIIPQSAASTSQKSMSPDGANEGLAMEDATMDMTMALGGIRQARQSQGDLIELESNADNEDMSMELTSVMGGVLASRQAAAGGRKSLPRRRRTMAGDDEATMDMTVGLGRIIPNRSEAELEDEEDNATVAMDMTTAVGGIIADSSPVQFRTLGRQMMEEEVDQNDSTPVAANSPSKRRLSALVGTRATPDAGSPGLSAFRGNGLRHSTNQRQKSSSPIRNPSPAKSSSPFKELTPTSKPASSPLRTPTSRRSPSRSASPQRPAASESATPKSAQRSLRRTLLFQQDPSTGVSTPRHVLTPQQRRLSGLGADRPGLGSPKVAQIMDRRGSIGDAANEFVPGKAGRGVSFADPRVLEEELDRDRRSEEDRERGRKILEREADGDGDNTTATLKDMISSMTPKKKSAPAKGRKSLHVGSARGLLGKRPAELDEDEERDERDGVKRLKGHQSSPVKNVRLNAPPTKAETTGRAARLSGRALEETSGSTNTPTISASPQKAATASSPQAKGKFRDVEDQPTNTFSFEEPPRLAEPDIHDDDQERIHLQDFLNMTSIRFMELTTTKRRHTQAPGALPDNSLQPEEDISLERCIVAGACTVPMLELYQHSCRELKKYISEGRRIVREIETETLEENPPLFKEYISASPDFKILMDNQFKNVKTHARLLSKAMWYEWRMKLQDGLKEGLIKIAEGMDEDERLLQKEKDLIQSVLPELVRQSEALGVEHENLQAIAQELADCDPQDLQAARAELMEVDSDMEAKMRQIEELQHSLKETELATDSMAQRKQECIASIAEAEQVREECRGWTSNEINSLKGKVEAIEKAHGWNITGISGTTISMTYRREIELVFDVAAFRGSSSIGPSSSHNTRIDLWYVAANREHDSQPSSPEKEFFVQAIRDYVRSLDQASTKISTLLRAVGAAWTKASTVANDVRILNCTFPTEIVKTSDSSVTVRVALLLAPLKTKVELVLELRAEHVSAGLQIAILPQAKVVYGEHFKTDKVCEYLATRMGDRVLSRDDNAEREPWSDIVVELHERLLARGRK